MNTLPIPGPPAKDVHGQPLDKLSREPMEITAFLKLAIRIARALAEMHQGGLIHKNIKPQNILVDPGSGEVRITDLRLSISTSPVIAATRRYRRSSRGERRSRRPTRSRSASSPSRARPVTSMSSILSFACSALS